LFAKVVLENRNDFLVVKVVLENKIFFIETRQNKQRQQPQTQISKKKNDIKNFPYQS
jgi:hypothetical protein